MRYTWKKYLALLSFVCTTALGQDAPLGSVGDAVEKDLYESRALQVETLLILQPPDDSLFAGLLADARTLAAAELYSEGIALLNILTELHQSRQSRADSIVYLLNEALTFNAEEKLEAIAEPNPALPQSRFQLESGVDYSQQEFELSLIQDDSLLVEQLQSPYFGAVYYHPLWFGDRWMMLNHRLRLDGQFFEYAFNSSLDIRGEQTVHLLRAESSLYLDRDAGASNFLDSHFSYATGNVSYLTSRWQFSSRLRYKKYFSAEFSRGDILSGSLIASYEHYFDTENSLSVNWIPTYYREFSPGEYRYMQSSLAADYHYWEDFNRHLDAGLKMTAHRFHSSTGLIARENSYISIEPALEFETPLIAATGLNAEWRYESRNYRTTDALNPDLDYTSLRTTGKFYLNERNSFGIGGFLELQRNDAGNQPGEAFTEQADFNGKGAVLSFEYLNLSGVIVNLSYQLSWRNYPHADNSLLNAYYSDRLIHSLSALGWIPLNDSWQIQFFANYDNDQDRKYEQNDNRNMLMNGGLIYRF